MAYNLESLINILKQILNPEQSRWILDQNKPQLQSLLDKSTSLQQQILEKSPLAKIESLEIRIREAAHEALDMIESHMVDQMLSSPGGTSFSFSTPDLHQVMRALDMIESHMVDRMLPSPGGTSFSFSTPDLHQVMRALDSAMEQEETTASTDSGASTVEEVDQHLLPLKDRLTGGEKKLEIVSIVGMGGIGKTTLARTLYKHPLITESFQVRAWATVSQDYDMRAILLSLLTCTTGELSNELIKCTNPELKHELYKSLFSRRYFIVLDDMWSTKFYDDISWCFPKEDNNENSNRIVVTTREPIVANYTSSQSQQHHVQLLSNLQSSKLLGEILFGKENCPLEYQGIVKKIAFGCHGLPLAINVVGGLLLKAPKSVDAWEEIGKDLEGAMAESDDQRFSNIFSKSYNYLPNHLKPCFLYMGAFPEAYEIKASKLVRLWVAEGFLKSTQVDKSSEEEAGDYINALVERNLIFVTQDKCNGKAKRYSMHDLLRDLCMRKADEEKFLHVKNAGPKVTNANTRRVSVHTSSYGIDDLYASTLARSFMCNGLRSSENLRRVFSSLRLLRVLDVMEINFDRFPMEIFELVNLRYLAVCCQSCLPGGISRLLNLQTLIASFGWGDLPCEIWEMPELRHLKLNEVIWVDDEYIKTFVHKMLQTISTVRLTRSLIRNGFFESIPNIKNLGIYCDVLPSSAVDLSHLHKLETLKCVSTRRRLLPILKFPGSIRKLTLVRCVIFPGVLKTLCALPNLEVLIIRECVFESDETYEEWEAEEGDAFRSLKFLVLEKLNLARWSCDETNFPVLRHLILRLCLKLEEIPSGIGDISSLELIQLQRCRASAVETAKQIQEEQQNQYDNYDIEVRTW